MVAGAIGSWPCCQEAEIPEYLCLVRFPFLHSPGAEPKEWHHLQWASLYTSANLIKTTLHRQAQKLFSQVILRLKLITEVIPAHLSIK